jgi:hypothetical protein
MHIIDHYVKGDEKLYERLQIMHPLQGIQAGF